jgi:hypothetical protein
VLAYNFLLRANREIARELEGFAQDLLACTVSAAQAYPDATSMAAPGRAADARGGS